MNDHIESVQRHGAALVSLVESALSPGGTAWLREVEARGGELQLTLNRRGEVWVSLVEDGRTRAVVFCVTNRGVGVFLDLVTNAREPRSND